MKKRYARILAATLSAAMVFTSAPTAAFATELSVSEDAVEAEGVVATNEEVAALFPSNNLVSVYASGTVIDKKDPDNSTPEETYTTSSKTKAGIVEDAEYAKLATLKPGQTADITFKVNLTDNTEKDYSNIQGYEYNAGATDEVVIKRTFTVTVVKGTYTTDTLYDAVKNNTAVVNGVYGSSTVTTTATGWSVKSVSSEVAKAEITSGTTVKVKGGVVLTTDPLSDADALYDLSAYAKSKQEVDSTFTYNTSTKCFEITADVVVGQAEIKSISFPTFTSTIYVGDSNADLTKKLSTTKASNGTFAVTAGDTTAAGEKAFTVTFTPDKNHKVATGISTTFAVLAKVEKKVIKDADLVPALPVADQKVVYGTTYATVLGKVNTNNSTKLGITYTLDSSVKGTDIIPLNTTSVPLVAAVTDSDTTQLEYGRPYRNTSVAITVEKPEISISYTNGSKADLAAYSDAKGIGNLTITASAADCDYDDVDSISTYATFEWYKDGKLVSTGAALNVSKTAISSGQYVCKMKYELTDDDYKSVFSGEANAPKIPAVKALVDGKVFETKPIDITVTALEGTVNAGAELNINYGDKDKSVKAEFKKEAGSTITSVTAYVADDKGNKYPVTDRLLSTDPTSSNTDAYLVVIPNGLDSGRLTTAGAYEQIPYKLYVEFATSKVDSNNKTVTDKIVSSCDLKIDQIAMPTGALTIDSADGKVVYGTKTSDIKLLVGGKPCAYGTLVVDEAKDYLAVSESGAKATKFTPSDETKKNYTDIGEDVFGNVTVTVTKAPLTLKVNDVKIKVGESLPAVSSIQKNYTLEGLVAGDKFETSVKSVKISYIGGLEQDIKKAGTVKDAVLVEAELYTAATANYELKTVLGNVVVEDATTPVAPSVKPTPAPVKQSVAAKAKAVKSKATVKVGKKYTLKLKYAAGKKATVKKVKWTSSKKSVATVSSKGKVTAKKAGKATITATITFKDGSKKKVKFTVTVK